MKWEEAFESKGLNVNLGKTGLFGERQCVVVGNLNIQASCNRCRRED